MASYSFDKTYVLHVGGTKFYQAAVVTNGSRSVSIVGWGATRGRVAGPMPFADVVNVQIRKGSKLAISKLAQKTSAVGGYHKDNPKWAVKKEGMDADSFNDWALGEFGRERLAEIYALFDDGALFAAEHAVDVADADESPARRAAKKVKPKAEDECIVMEPDFGEF